VSTRPSRNTVRGVRVARWAGRPARFWLAVALLFLTGIVYGLTYSLTGVAIANGVPFISYVFWMGMGGAAITLLMSIGTGRLPPLYPAHIKAFLVAGMAGFGIPFLTVGYVSGKGVPAGIISMLVALAPVLTYVGAVMLRLERFWWLRFFGFIVGIMGVAMLVVPDTSLPSRDLVPWILVALVLPVGYTVTSLATAVMRPPQTESLHFAFGYFFFGSLPVLAVVAVSGDWWWFEGPMDDGDWALIIAIFAQALGIYLFVELIRVMGPVFFSGVNFIVALAGVGWGIVFFDESHSGWVWGALALLMAGVFFVIYRRPSPQPVPEQTTPESEAY
jgi:drug/metabolite transporter (DMT)-like permease